MSRAERSDPDSSPCPGAAQFIANLSPQQLQHLQFSTTNEEETVQSSQYLESPRQVPVPKRFTIDALDLARVKESQNEGCRKHARKESMKSRPSGSDNGSSSRVSLVLLKEVERVKGVEWRFYATGIALCVLNLVAAWDATTLSIALPTIAAALRGSTFETFWLGISFFVAATCFLPLFAIFSDIFGRKPILLTAMTFFTIGSFIAAVTGNTTGLLLGRTIQGIGAGGIYVLSSLLVSDLASPVDVKLWRAILGATWALGAVTGPIIGAALSQHGQWRWIFWINLPFCTATFVVLAFVARLKSASSCTVYSKLGKVDVLGFIILAGSLVSTLLGLTWGGTLADWSNSRTILPLLFGVIGLLLFVVWVWLSPYPSLLRLDWSLSPIYFGAMVQGMIVSSALYFLPLYLSVARRSHTLVQVALSLCAWSVSLAVFAFLAFFVVTKTTLHRQLTWFAWFLVVVGIALMVTFTRESATIMWLCIAVFSGFGIGILYPSLSAFALSNTPSECDINPDSAVTNLVFFQTLGQTLGIAIGSTIFQNQLHSKLLKIPVIDRLAARYVQNAFALVNILRDLSVDQEALKTQVADAFVGAIRVIWIVMAVLAGVAMLASLFVQRLEDSEEESFEMKIVGGECVV